MRDPFLFSVLDAVRLQPRPGSPDAQRSAALLQAAKGGRRRFWLFGTTDRPPDGIQNPYGEFPAEGFDCFSSEDLVSWEGPFAAFRAPSGFFADTQFWAPEVYFHKGRLLMFATVKKSGSEHNRGVVVLESKALDPAGPFLPASNGPITPSDWSCLDGTLHVENGIPFMVFCREWTQVRDGQICAVELNEDLAMAKGKPFTLFRASQAPWAKSFWSSSHNSKGNYITDGPWLHRCQESEELVMLWSSKGQNDKYCVGVARSASGVLRGPWLHDSKPIFEHDGGHAMISELALDTGLVSRQHTLLVLALHTPNDPRKSHPKIFGVIEDFDPERFKVNFSCFEFL